VKGFENKYVEKPGVDIYTIQKDGQINIYYPSNVLPEDIEDLKAFMELVYNKLNRKIGTYTAE